MAGTEGTSGGTGGQTGRRAEYAEATRQAIVAAAHDLFLRQGFASTTVAEIAAQARVSSATVYAVGGGKQGLLRTVIEAATRAPNVAQAYAQVGAHDDAVALLRWITEQTRTRFEQWSGLMRVVVATAPHEPSAAAAFELARDSLRGALVRTAQRLSELDALRPEVDVEQATDVLWFHLGNAAYFTLTDENGWSLDRAQDWLGEALIRALLR